MRKLQRAILRSKNKIALISGILILAGFLVKWTAALIPSPDGL